MSFYIFLVCRNILYNLWIEKENYGWGVIKIKENLYYKLGVIYRNDTNRTIEMEKSLGLIPQN